MGFFRGRHTSDFKIGTPVATLSGAWRYRVSAVTGWSDVSILWLGEVESLICNFYLSVAARKIEQIRPWDTLACCWDVKQPTSKQTTLKSTVCVELWSQNLHRFPFPPLLRYQPHPPVFAALVKGEQYFEDIKLSRWASLCWQQTTCPSSPNFHCRGQQITFCVASV